MLPADNTTRVGIATLSFSKPQTYFDDVLQYTVRTFDLTVNNSSVYNETGYPAPVDDEVRCVSSCLLKVFHRRMSVSQLQLTFPDYTHEYGVQVRVSGLSICTALNYGLILNQIAAITIDGYGPYGSTVTTVWSASPTASVSVSVAPSVSPSPSRVPPELIKKRRLNEIIMGLSFTVAGLALCVALAVVFMEWRRRVAEEEAKRPKPLPVSAVIELEPEVSGATAPSINRVKSGGVRSP